MKYIRIRFESLLSAVGSGREGILLEVGANPFID